MKEKLKKPRKNSKKTEKMRIDIALSERGLARSRTHAKNLIELGAVKVNGLRAEKPSLEVGDSDILTVDENADFASLGGIKLKHAKEAFGIDFKGVRAIDVGCSNGGFSAVILDGGASSLTALDVGDCALAESVAKDVRTTFVKANARTATLETLGGIPFDFASVDLSFISLKLVLPNIKSWMKKGGEIVALVKPQFELYKSALTKNGIVKSKKLAEKCVAEVAAFAESLGFSVNGPIEAPHPFEDKNQEYLIQCKC